MTTAALPELHEAEAPPEVAAIYAGLREAMGVPVVNLIWRHFATLPGVLPWAWEATRGVIGSATVAEGAERMAALLVRAASGADVSVVGTAARALPAAERARVADVVRVYNRGNRVNLQVLSAVRHAIASGGVPVGGERPAAGVALAAIVASVPPLPRVEELPDATRAEAEALAALHDPSEPVVPSLYRHLALWPALLPPLRESLAPLFAEGRIAALRDSLLGVAEESATALLPRLAPPGPFPPEHRDAVLRVLAVFPGKLIAEMAAVGLLLKAELQRA